MALPLASVLRVVRAAEVTPLAGAPEAASLAPASARGWFIPGLSPALLGMLVAGGEE